MDAIVTPTDLPTRYESRDAEKARLIGKILALQGFEVRLFTRQQVVTDVDGKVIEVKTDPRFPSTVLRTNASHTTLNEARAQYRAAEAEITASAVADMLGI